jgi:hypothetical protein
MSAAGHQMSREEADAAFEQLSPKAQLIASGILSMMRPGEGRMCFGAEGHARASSESQAALDELVAAGLVSMHTEDDGGTTYIPLVRFPSYDPSRFRNVPSFPLTQGQTPEAGR